MKQTYVIIGIAIAAMGLAACGGGGGTSLPPQPTATATPAVATATGKVVDYDTQSGLAGVQVAIGAYSSGAATPAPVATTAADGTFTFQTKPGNYLLRIGSDSSSDTRTTLVQHITLGAGSNALTVATPPPAPNVTPDPVQLSGNFRLKALSADDTACLSGANQGFASLSVGPFAQDEYEWETQRWNVIEDVAAGSSSNTPMKQNGDAGNVAMLGALYNNATGPQWGESGYSFNGYTSAQAQTDGSTASKYAQNQFIAHQQTTLRFGMYCDPVSGYAEGDAISDFR